MKRFSVYSVLFVAVVMVSAAGCRRPFQEPVFEEIGPNETAFLIPLTGANKKNQGRFDSADFLENQKVAAKRISIPTEWVQTGRKHADGKWVPIMRVLKVDRSPVSREWTSDLTSGTSVKDQAVYVESKDSIGFYIGVSISAAVEEEDTALFLYRFPSGRGLSKIVDKDI